MRRFVVFPQSAVTSRPVGVQLIDEIARISVGCRYASKPRFSVSAILLQSANDAAEKVSGIPEDDTHLTVVVLPEEQVDAKFVRWSACNGQFSSAIVCRYVKGADSRHEIFPWTGVVVWDVVWDVVADVVDVVVGVDVTDVVADVVTDVVTVVTSQFTNVPA